MAKRQASTRREVSEIKTVVECGTHMAEFKVTGRKSKQNERPRRHTCSQCGQKWDITVSGGRNGKVTKSVPA